MTAPVAVIGTGGMGREALAWLRDAHPTRRILGFLDNDPDTHGTEVAGLPVLGYLDWLGHRDVDVLIGVGSGAARARLDDEVTATGRQPLTVVHPTAVIGPRSTVAPGAIIAPGVVVTTDVTIGRCAILNYGCAIGHDCRIGDHAFIAPGAHLAGFVTVGARAEVGIGASVRQHLEVAADAVVGGGAMVVRPVGAGQTVVGVPARPMDLDPRD